MKQAIIIISSLFFSTLFYSQNIGLNLSIFSILTLIVLIISNTNKFKNKATIIYTLLYLVTAAIVFLQHTTLSIITNCVVFFTLIGSITEAKSSIFVNWLNGVYTTVAGFFHRSFDFNKKEAKPTPKKDIDFLHWIKLIGIPLVFIIVFILLYKNGNSVFNDLISQINLKFINMQWILFSVLGYFIFSNIINPVEVEHTTKLDLETGNSLFKGKNFSEEDLKKEKQLGTTLMLLLNVLIVFYLVTDIIAISTSATSNAETLSNQVHNGINALIASIVIAIVIILYFFRGNLNFYKHNKTLKSLAFIWIILNAVLVILIALKNNIYVSSFGFTYKRVGVYIYLLLTFIGLVTTFLKVLKVKNLLFLFRVNTQIAFAILMLCSTVNWDYHITYYNINYAQSVDLNYLIKLSNNNASLLKTYNDKNTLSSNNYNRINNKHTNFIELLEDRNWQEYTYENLKQSNNTKKQNY
ncbi:DUF4173 domain-containing protein [uncultured Lacinutrix sp.]|uniref:DUF4153 domain-containing protein n=1 Tax=uncultured Lacinutrix sp. TaxID=574032 RepID=UPI002625ADC3|nr:DUF4173 domain-containing protein [uncultured Lacinutrix sp.]